MAKKKKLVKRSTGSSRRFGMDNNTFLLIVGGGFVVIMLVMMMLNGMWKNEKDSTIPAPTPVSMKDTQSKANIQVTSPEKNAVVGRPVTIKGKAQVFENMISYRIKDSDGFVLVSGTNTYVSPKVGEMGDFTITTNYLEPKGTAGVVQVYSVSAKDGSEENLVSVPVTFK